MGRKISSSIALVLLSLLIGPISATPLMVEFQHRQQDSYGIAKGSGIARLNYAIAALGDQLLQNRDMMNLGDSFVAITSPVMLDDLKSSNKVGLIIQEGLMHEMHSRGLKVVDFKLMPTIQVTPVGDFAISRNLKHLKTQYAIHFVLTGTMTSYANGVIINIRMIDAESSVVVSTAQIQIPGRTYLSLLQPVDTGKPKTVIAEPADANSSSSKVALTDLDSAATTSPIRPVAVNRAAKPSVKGSTIKAATEPVTADRIQRQLILSQDSGDLSFGSAELTSLGKKRLDKFITSINQTAEREKLQIVGYTDSIGNAAYNKLLSTQRAGTVSTYLAMNNIDAQEITVLGQGEESPVASNKFEKGRKKNRRVEISVID